MKFSMLFISIVILLVFLDPEKSCSQTIDGIAIKFAPLSLIDPIGSNIHVGCEFLNSRRVNLETDFAFYLPNKLKEGVRQTKADRIGIKIKPELRIYRKSDSKQYPKQGLYFANEVFVVLDQYQRGDLFAAIDEEGIQGEPYWAFEKVKRFELGDHLKLGVQKRFLKKLIIDGYFGLGMKYYNSRKLTRISDPKCCQVMRFFDPLIGKGVFPSFTIGIKIGLKQGTGSDR